MDGRPARSPARCSCDGTLAAMAAHLVESKVWDLAVPPFGSSGTKEELEGLIPARAGRSVWKEAEPAEHPHWPSQPGSHDKGQLAESQCLRGWAGHGPAGRPGAIQKVFVPGPAGAYHSPLGGWKGWSPAAPGSRNSV